MLVVLAKAGTQWGLRDPVDSRFRGNDGGLAGLAWGLAGMVWGVAGMTVIP
jgi:hypothetical protein